MPNAVEPLSVAPRSLAEVLDLLATGAGEPPWRPIAGGTDLMVQLTGEIGTAPERIVDLWGLDELRGITVAGRTLTIGALTTYTDLRRSPVISEHLPVLAEAAATIGAAQIQNRGTIGGNVVNASPAGDTLPVLLALDARIVLVSVTGERSVPAAGFWPSYRTTARRDDELVARIEVPLDSERQVRFRKVGTRRAQAISKVVLALAWRVEAGRWTDVRVALGSVAATPVRATATEAVLEGSTSDASVADRARQALEEEIHPIDDVRSTAVYRRMVAGRVLHRMLRDEGGW